MHHGSGMTSRSIICLFFTANNFLLLTRHAFRYRHADTSGEGSAASVDIFDLTSRNKLSPALQRRMKLVPEFITALKEAYRRKTTVSL